MDTNNNNSGMHEELIDDLHTVMLDEYETGVHIGVSSVIGRRQQQQDAVKADDFYSYIENERVIAVLCDGMGGLASGEKASECCSSVVYDAFHSGMPIHPIQNFYRSIIFYADEEVKSLKNEDGSPVVGAGTTLASVIIDGHDLYWGSVGDSRIYIVRGDQILCVTHDHNYLMILNQRVQQGEITREEAESDPQKEALVSYIGMGGIKYIDLNAKPVRLLNGDQIILCSDGLYRSVSEDEIKQIVTKHGKETQLAAEELTSFALSKNFKTQDNTSVVVISFENVG